MILLKVLCVLLAAQYIVHSVGIENWAEPPSKKVFHKQQIPAATDRLKG